MPTPTSNFAFNKPLVNNAVDEDLWGGQLNANWDSVDAKLALVTSSETSTFNVVAADFNKTFLVDASSADVTANLPALSSVFDGFVVHFVLIDATNKLILDGNSSETVNGATTYDLDAQYQSISAVADSTGWFLNLTPVQFDITATVSTQPYADKMVVYDNSASSTRETLLADSTTNYNELKGLALAIGSDADHDVDVGVGVCRDSSNITSLSLTSGLTKQLDATWAAGDNAGGLFSGTVANTTRYYFFVIKKDSDGTIDAGFDTSASAANIPSGYTAYRNLGSVLTDGSANIASLTKNLSYDRQSFVSANQTITSAGLLTLAHGLSAAPTSISCVLECTSGDANYSIGDKIFFHPDAISRPTDTGCSIYSDATNVYVRYGSNSAVFFYPNKTSGATNTLTNSSWELIVTAFY